MKMKNKALAIFHVIQILIYYFVLTYFLWFAVVPYSQVVLRVLIALHLACACGALMGANWGRRMSQVLGALLLLGFPVGTIVGGLILSRSGKKWTTSEPADPDSLPV